MKTFPPHTRNETGSIKLYREQDKSKEAFMEELSGLGYAPSGFVSHEGDFAHRGGVVDVFPIGYDCPIRVEFCDNKINAIYSFNLISSEMSSLHQMIMIPPFVLTHSRAQRVNPPDFGETMPIDNFVDIMPGDIVVHVDHGIGIYRGLKKVKEQAGDVRDYMLIEYADKDKLYVPAREINLIQKYISFYKHAPRLSRLGSKAWQKAKDKTRRIASSYALELLHMQASRMKLKGFLFSKDTDWQKTIEGSFPYKDTIDQAKASSEVKADMEASKPMDRLLCGDVGYGKTEVALRASFKAVMDNKQVAILVPTTILAEQHYNTFCTRMKDYPVNIQMLSRFRTKGEQARVLAGLKDASIDIVIGTHRLLSDDIIFKDLGLVVIDEEQRFGVKAKEKFKTLRLLVDVLTMTATPIPRTLYMSLTGARDMSVINTPPPDRLPIKTIVSAYDDSLLKKFILNEVSRKGQVYFINNRIDGIDKMAKRIQGLCGSSTRVALAHGRMSAKELEAVMLDFIKGRIGVLVSTTIVESGIDIPNANTIIINNADKFGLADLYQLRGRVGRFNVKAFCLCLVSKRDIPADSRRRLMAIERFTQLGSGFKIAMEDLQIRGAGNILGTQQHGYIAAVGFDLYCRLLRDAVHQHKIRLQK
ncbi:MAG: CarD family transcriptional regulator [Candidatus Omnitrophica bacterium]|nr:CarD family transcriptional regulator [Candidatus Omnitrophota bacterium]